MKTQALNVGDIPLKNAMILWNLLPPLGDGKVKVVWHMKEDDEGFQKSWGACCAGWTEGGRERTELLLLQLLWEIAVDDELDVKEIHNAMRVIPEYRDMMIRDT